MKTCSCSRCLCLVVLTALLMTLPAPAWADSTPGVSPDVEAVVEGNNTFALDLYAQLSRAKQNDNKNLFFSPHSLSTALAMTAAGARGQTEAEMAKVLHFPFPTAQVHPAMAELAAALRRAENDNLTLLVANRLWGQKDYAFLPEFLATTKKDYGAELAQVDFIHDAEAARKTINAWVERQTRQKIRNLIPKGMLDRLTRLVLTNAVYFKGQWQSPFDKKRTLMARFRPGTDESTVDPSVRVPMMHKVDDFAYADLPELQILELPYAGEQVSMIVLLPKKVDGLPDLEKSLDVKTVQKWFRQLRRQKVVVYLPRFSTTGQFELSKTLSALGMPRAFDPDEADFSGMTSKPDLFVSKVIHKAFVDVNEEGTEAAAATAVIMKRKGGPSALPTFRADHPFVFLIRHKPTGSILFLGRLIRPEPAESKQAVKRAAKPMFKGMELYSWKPAGKDWHFKLVPGRNWRKPGTRVEPPEKGLLSVGQLKQHLAQLAEGENIFWTNLADTPVPADMVKEVSAFCKTKDLKLFPIEKP
ncbi:MAG: serpin family protein [Pirellulales bacterium]|nr:serpin family protein [Pirellulales bacterium]